MLVEVIEQREVLGKEFKMYGTIENPLFLAKDVATWLDIANTSQMVRNIDEDEKRIEVTPIYNVYNGQFENQECLFLTEYGLYEVLMLSRKPLAKEFKKKVKEILKALRLNQIQISNTTNDIQISNTINELTTMLNTFTNVFSDFVKQQTEFNKMITNIITNNTSNNEIQTSISEDEVENEILNFENSFMSVQDFSEYLNSKNIAPKKLGALILYQLLRDNNIIDKDNKPIQNNYFKKINKKFFLTKEGMIVTYKLAKEQVTVDYMVRRGY